MTLVALGLSEHAHDEAKHLASMLRDARRRKRLRLP